MTQHSFDFAPKPDEEARDIGKWVERHNQQALMAARVPGVPSGSLLSAIDRGEAKTSAVYLLRGVLGQCLKKTMEPGSAFKGLFLQALRGEMSVKKTSQDPAFVLRDILMKTRAFRQTF